MKKITFLKTFALFAGLLLIAVTSGWGQAAWINENIQDWTDTGGYVDDATQEIDVGEGTGTVTMVDVWVQPNATAAGNTGFVQFRPGTLMSIIELPPVPNVFSVEFFFSAFGGGRSVELQRFDGEEWVVVTEFTDIDTSGDTYTYDLYLDEETTLRLTEPSHAMRVHDIIVYEYVEPTQVATPNITPPGGTFYSVVEVNIETATEGATIHYTTDGNEPTEGSPEFTDPFPVFGTDGTVITIKAIAVKEDMENSNVASADFTFPPITEVASIAELQDEATGTGDGTVYRITGEVFMTYMNDSRNQKYFQDALDGGAGIKIDDAPGHLDTPLDIGDGITGLTGTLSQFNRMLQFNPLEGEAPETANSFGNELIPMHMTLAQLIDSDNFFSINGDEFSVYQALLIIVEQLQFEQTGNFDSGTNFGELPISDPTASLQDIDDADKGTLFRVEYADLEYNGDPIPQDPVNLTAIVDQRFDNTRIFARSWDDIEIEEIEDPFLSVNPASLSGLSYAIGNGPSDAQSFQLSGNNLDGTDVTVAAPADFEISESETGAYGSAITLSAYDGAANTIWVRLSEGLAIDDYSGNVAISGGGADAITVAVSGSVTAPPSTDLPFTTNFGMDDKWWSDGAMGSYTEKSYTEGGWYFHSTEAVRGGAAESYNGSPYSFRDRLVFTVYNEAAINGMTGFGFQLRDWMASATLDRDLNISFDGGTTWETVLTINRDWFDAFQVYQQFLYYFDDPQDFAAEGFQIEIIGGIAGSNDGRINIGQFEALVDDPDDIQDATLATFTVGGVNVLGLSGLVVNNPNVDPGATLEVEDFTDFAGIVVETTDPAATFTVSLNGVLLDHGDLPDQPIEENDVIVVTVTSANGTVVRHHKVTVVAEEEPVELITNGFFQFWTEGLPDGWYGDKSNIGHGNVNQYSTNPHSGSYSAQLVRDASAHRRFTSQPTQVNAGVEYEITFWVKGQGEIRTGLFDDRETGFGYAPYNDYIIVESDTWTEHTQYVTAENTTDIAEFIFSVRNTAGNDRSVSGHILLDSVTAKEPPPPYVMIPLPIWVIFFSGLLMAGFLALRRRK